MLFVTSLVFHHHVQKKEKVMKAFAWLCTAAFLAVLGSNPASAKTSPAVLISSCGNVTISKAAKLMVKKGQAKRIACTSLATLQLQPIPAVLVTKFGATGDTWAIKALKVIRVARRVKRTRRTRPKTKPLSRRAFLAALRARTQ